MQPLYARRLYQIAGVEHSMTVDSTFMTKDGETTFRQYYQSRYNLKINDTTQPLLIVRDRKTGEVIYLVPELCCLAGLDEAMK